MWGYFNIFWQIMDKNCLFINKDRIYKKQWQSMISLLINYYNVIIRTKILSAQNNAFYLIKNLLKSNNALDLEQIMNIIRLLPIALLGLALTACQSFKDDPFNTTHTAPTVQVPTPTPDKNLEFLKEMFEKDQIRNGMQRERLICPAVYKPVCVTYTHNGKNYHGSFNNKCYASGLNIVNIGDGFCE
ncbi:hypothetical protein B0182_03330 [Moraxella bovis]|nr:hypothetical protein DQF64_10050 [Moraxella bovis]OOR91254.1 hypothetical protein B0182_03330 [Moraxella bovis]